MIEQLPALQIIVPLMTAPLCVLLRNARATWILALAATWFAFATSIMLLLRVVDGSTISYALGDWPPPWGIELRIDAINAFVLLIVTGISSVVLAAAPRSLEAEVSRERHYLFFAAYLLCMTGLLGMTATGDAFNVFVFLEISSLSSYALIALGPTRRALHSSFQYLVMGTLGGTFILLGIGMLYMVTGTLNIADLGVRLAAVGPNRTVLVALAVIVVGTSIKLALFPLHAWLPNAYTYAPALVTAFLAATATKVAYYVLVRFVFRVFGVELLAFTQMRLDALLMPMALLAMFIASTLAIYQSDVKRMLAYSSLAQIGYMVLGLSFASVTGLTGGIVHLFNHALMKSGLFLALACVVLRLGSTRLDDLRGLGRRMPLTAAAFVAGGLGLIGVPATAGFVSKWYLVLAAFEGGYPAVAVLILLSSLLAVVYVWRVVEVVYFQPPPDDNEVSEAPWSLLAPTWLLIGATFFFGLFTSASVGVAERAASLLVNGGNDPLSPATATFLAVIWPLLGAVGIALAGEKRRNLREAATLATAVSLFTMIVAVILPAVRGGARPRIDLVEVLPGLSLAFEVEPLGMLFALVASGLWIVTSVFAVGYMRGHHETNQTRFYVCFASAIAFALGVAFAANVFTLFLFYEAITLSTYPLVTHHGTEKAKQAGRVYLGILMGTSIAFLLLALVWTYFLAGTTEFRPGGILTGKAGPTTLVLLLALYAFGTGKAALMPFHRWLPAAMVAPTPVSALLHAVAVVKAGVFTVMKVLVYVFGVDLLAETGAATWLVWVAAFTLMSASITALTRDNLKARLAYSTISQLAYIVLGAALAHSWGVIGGSMHIVMHAMGKITLFFCAGAIYVVADETEISRMHGLGRRMPWTFGAFLVGSLSVIGVPPLGGSWSKWYLALGAAEAGNQVVIAVLMISSLLSIGYLMPVVGRAFYTPPRESAVSEPTADDSAAAGADHPPDTERAHWLCVLPPVVTAAGCVALFFFADSIYRLLLGMIP